MVSMLPARLHCGTAGCPKMSSCSRQYLPPLPGWLIVPKMFQMKPPRAIERAAALWAIAKGDVDATDEACGEPALVCHLFSSNRPSRYLRLTFRMCLLFLDFSRQ